MLDQEFPMTRRQAKSTVLALLVGGIVGVAVFGGIVPGLHPSYAAPEFVSLNGHQYHWTEILVPAALPGTNGSMPISRAVHNTTFWIWVYIDHGDRTWLAGNATITGGGFYNFSIGGQLWPTMRPAQYISPDSQVAVVWSDWATAMLLSQG